MGRKSCRRAWCRSRADIYADFTEDCPLLQSRPRAPAQGTQTKVGPHLAPTCLWGLVPRDAVKSEILSALQTQI